MKLEKVELRPIKTGASTIFPGKDYYEQIICIVQGYPIAMVHADTFYTSGGNEIYDLLNVGQSVIVDITVTALQTNEEE